MGLLTGALFIGWRRARGRERRLERAYAAQNEELQELMAAVFCCQCCDWCGCCRPDDWCPDCAAGY
jgi:hypothetical protein